MNDMVDMDEGSKVEAMEPKRVLVLTPPERDVPVDYETGYFRLGMLRPDDKFKFVREVPYDGLSPDQLYRVLPARRGFIKFTDDKSALYSVPIDYAIGIRVLVEGIFKEAKRYYFYGGDRVQSKDSGGLGVVHFSRGQGYLVLFDGLDKPQWVHGDSMKLVDKDLTTRNYICYDVEKDTFLVDYSVKRSEHETAIDALKWLYINNKPAHHRLSLLISRLTEDTERDVFDDLCWVDDDVLNYLYGLDTKAWDTETVSRVSELLKTIFDEEACDDV